MCGNSTFRGEISDESWKKIQLGWKSFRHWSFVLLYCLFHSLLLKKFSISITFNWESKNLEGKTDHQWKKDGNRERTLERICLPCFLSKYIIWSGINFVFSEVNVFSMWKKYAVILVVHFLADMYSKIQELFKHKEKHYSLWFTLLYPLFSILF